MRSKSASLEDSAPALASDRRFDKEGIEFFVEIAQMLGMPKSVGQIYGVIYFSPIPLSFTDIVEQLGISNGSASQGLQFLRSIKAVNLSSYSDARREYFEIELGLRKLVVGILKERVYPLLISGEARIKRMRELSRNTNEARLEKFQIERIKQLEKWRKQMGLILPVIRTLLGSPRR